MKNICQTIKPFLFLLVEATDAKWFMDKKENISDKLSELRKENSFSVPEDYFDNFQQRLQARIQTEKTGSVRKRNSAKVYRLAWVSAVAAVFIIALFIGRNIIGIRSNPPLSQEEISLAFTDEIYDLDEFELTENIDEIMYDKDLDEEYSDDIILYLLDEDIEIDKIVNEL